MRYLILFIVMLTVFELRSQVAEPVDPTHGEDTSAMNKLPDISGYLQKKKLNVHLEFGTSFSSFSNGGSYFNTYVAPQLQFRFNKKLSIHGGFEMINPVGAFGQNTEQFNNPFFGYGPHPRSLIYAGGAYQLTENIVLSGTAFKEIRPFFNRDLPSPLINSDYKGVIMGLDYKVGDNMFIRGQVEISNGMSPYRFNPLGGSQFFDTDPFQTFPPF